MRHTRASILLLVSICATATAGTLDYVEPDAGTGTMLETCRELKDRLLAGNAVGVGAAELVRDAQLELARLDRLDRGVLQYWPACALCCGGALVGSAIGALVGELTYEPPPPPEPETIPPGTEPFLACVATGCLLAAEAAHKPAWILISAGVGARIGGITGCGSGTFVAISNRVRAVALERKRVNLLVSRFNALARAAAPRSRLCPPPGRAF